MMKTDFSFNYQFFFTCRMRKNGLHFLSVRAVSGDCHPSPAFWHAWKERHFSLKLKQVETVSFDRPTISNKNVLDFRTRSKMHDQKLHWKRSHNNMMQLSFVRTRSLQSRKAHFAVAATVSHHHLPYFACVRRSNSCTKNFPVMLGNSDVFLRLRRFFWVDKQALLILWLEP